MAVVPAAGGEAKQVSFLANSNATGISWSPDGTFLLFDTGQRTEVSQLARVDLTLRTPKFREDQFRDLFNEENPRVKPAPADVSPKPATPPDVDTASPAKADTTSAAKADDKKTDKP